MQKVKSIRWFLIGLSLLGSLLTAWILNFSLLFMFISWMVIWLGVFGYQHLHQVSQKESEQLKLVQAMMDAFSLLKVLIDQGMLPYQAMKKMLPFLSKNLISPIQGLLDMIEQDTSIQPYLKCSEAFHSLMIEQLFFSLYQLENQGGKSDSFIHFQYLFDQADHQFDQRQLHALQERMQSASGMVMIATGVLAFSLLIGVMQLLAGMLYGS